MVHFMLPKIYRQRKKVQRELKKQKRMLETFAADLNKEAEKEASGASKETLNSLSTPRSFHLDECPADNLECPSAPGHSELPLVTPALPPAHPTQAGDEVLGRVVAGEDVRVSTECVGCGKLKTHE